MNQSLWKSTAGLWGPAAFVAATAVIRAHSRGGADDDGESIMVHLSKYSCLGDALGSATRPTL